MAVVKGRPLMAATPLLKKPLTNRGGAAPPPPEVKRKVPYNANFLFTPVFSGVKLPLYKKILDTPTHKNSVILRINYPLYRSLIAIIDWQAN